MKKKLFLIKTAVILLMLPASSQEGTDTAHHTLQAVIINAYEGSRRLKEVPAGINTVSSSQLSRYDNSNILTALNSTPGVKMEERSPGSYRLNIRGSSIRSPFGVRNVKIYWNDIPFTDPGGNTYLNQLSIYNFQSIEIIKGPSGSLYGAGNGGVLLINQNPVIKPEGLDINLIAGSFNMSGLNVQLQGGNDKLANSFNIGRLHKDGYRNHSEMKRDVATWQMQLRTSAKNKMVFNFLYGDLFYQTPGGLNRTEYNLNPKAARPAAGVFPSAETARAAIYQKMYLGGITNHFQISNQLSNTTVFYAEKVELRNPTFRNYEARNEPHYGGRTVFKWNLSSSKTKTVIVFGAEMQKGNFNISTYSNNNGMPDNLFTNDDVRNRNVLAFAQADFSFASDLNITLGAGLSSFKIAITRLNTAGPQEQSRTYTNEIAPRIAISKRVIKDIWLYGTVAKGFSPPTVAEVLPSNSVISTTLNAEHGINYEAGIKSTWLKGKIYVEATGFYYRLKDAIVQRRDTSNADYFINAGSTKQKGLEWQVQYIIIRDESKKVNHLSLRLIHSLHDFRYNDFKQLTNDFSKKNLPGVPENTVAALFDISLKTGAYMNLTYYYGDRVALNDANTEYATSYNLLGMRLGWKNNKPHKSSRIPKFRDGIELFAGADNLFDVRYSLGNDMNAAGGRFFNTAAGRNIYTGISLHLVNRK